MHSAEARRWLQWLLVFVGIGCLSYYASAAIGAARFQRHEKQRLEQLLARKGQPVRATDVELAPASSPRPAVTPRGGSRPASLDIVPIVPNRAAGRTSAAMRAAASRAAGEAFALLEIPRLGVSTPVVAGDDEASLAVAVGHLPDTPWPWEPGNSAIAAHRDGIFRPLKNVRAGDRITMRTGQGDFEYRVRDTRVVAPSDVSVLAPQEADALTLITCYPFNYIGAAPQRFIVHALRVSAGGATTGERPGGTAASVARSPSAAPVVKKAAAVKAPPSLGRTVRPRAVRTQRAATTTARTRAVAAAAPGPSGARASASAARNEDAQAAPANGGNERPSKFRRWVTRLFKKGDRTSAQAPSP